MTHLVEDKNPAPGKYCLRCGAERKEAAREKLPCRIYGLTYRFHMWKPRKRQRLAP